jgi:hypothetical protein
MALAAQKYFLSGSARTALLASKVLPVEIFDIERQFLPPVDVERRWKSKKRGMLPRSDGEQVENATSIGYGWLLGEFTWDCYGYSGAPLTNWLTVLLNSSPESPTLSRQIPYHAWLFAPNRGGLARVRPYSRGYEYVATWRDQFGGRYEHSEGKVPDAWIAAAEAVKHLIEVSN